MYLCKGFCPHGTPWYLPDYNNFDPRVGFAWAVGKTVFRGGTGIFHGPGQIDHVNTPLDNVSERYSLTTLEAPGLSYTNRSARPSAEGECWISSHGAPSTLRLDSAAGPARDRIMGWTPPFPRVFYPSKTSRKCRLSPRAKGSPAALLLVVEADEPVGPERDLPLARAGNGKTCSNVCVCTLEKS
jgi:hypothetical protein